MERMEKTIAEKIESLMKYRESLDENERELFDVLIHYANEVAIAIEQGISPISQTC
ncbi:MAG: hypothetical protein V1861_02010 [Candidatus Micrarchaeota archaeon]